MEAIVFLLVGLGIGLLCHAWWRKQLLESTKPMLQKLGVDRYPPSSWQLLQDNLNVAAERWQKERVKQEQLGDLLENSTRLQQALPLGFIQLDRYNRLLQCNPAAKSLFNISSWKPGDNKVLLEWVRSYELDLLVQSTRLKVVHPLSSDPTDVAPPKPEELATPEMREWLFYPPDGMSKPIPIRGWGIPLSEGQVGVLIEDRREATDLAQQRDRWASDVAHELKTPLTSIRLVAETLQQRVDPSLRKWVDRLLNEILRLSDLVQDLLELSRLDLKTSGALQLTNVDLVETIHSAWRSLEPLSEQKQQQLVFSGPATVEFCGDQSRIHRLFLNLLDNAIKYGPAESKISVSLQVQEEQVAIEICDGGPGFSPEAIDRIFERFYRTDVARARSQGGTGLGLAIAKQIVEAHGGTIAARNHPNGGGACLFFTLSRRMKVPTGAG